MNKSSILIIKPDHIGDYILFRNFLKEIKKSQKFKNYRLIVLLNTRVKDLAEVLDAGIVDKFIWMDLERFIKNGWYANRKIQEVLFEEYTCVLNAMFARFKSVENLIQQIEAEEKVFFKGHKNERSLAYKIEDEETYNKEIKLGDLQLFEFERFRIGIEEFLEEQLPLVQPNLKLDDGWFKSIQISKPYCLLFIGADVEYRKLSIAMYANIIEYIQNYYNIDVVVTAGQQEKEDAESIISHLKNNRVYNLVGETSLVDLVALINSASYIISNETGAAHIATLLSKPTIVLSNGNHFGKFTPYPKEYFKSYYPIYPFEYKGKKKEFDKFLNLFYNGSSLDIKSITLDRIALTIDQVSETLHIKKQLISAMKPFNSQENIQYTFQHKQTMVNYNFSMMFSRLYEDLMVLKKESTKIILYGNSNFAKVVASILSENLIAIVDTSSKLEDYNGSKILAYSPNILDSLEYDKIVITVLGRENEILTFLQKKLKINKDKIVIFRVMQGRYLEC